MLTNSHLQTDWSSFYAPGPEILAYLQSVVDKYKLMPYIKLQHEVLDARYDEPSAKWHVRIRRRTGIDAQGAPTFDDEFTDTADVFITGLGIFSKWSWPNIEGLKDFGGKLLHSADFGEENQHWRDVVKNWKDKKVGVIGIVSAYTPRELPPASDIVPGLDSDTDCASTAAACRQGHQLCPWEGLDLSTIREFEACRARQTGP